jgi:hypothetical protein
VIGDLGEKFLNRFMRTWALVGLVLLGAAYFGSHVSLFWVILPMAGIGGVILVQRPVLGLLTLTPVALVIPIELGTGTEVPVNAATLLMPALLALWVFDMTRRRDFRLTPSRTNGPLALFLLAGLLSLLIGNAFWDPAVPRSGRFIIVQLAQWAIFAFSAGVFWLTGNLVHDELWLRRLTFFYLAIAGAVAIFFVSFGGVRLVSQVVSVALIRAPFWLLLAAVACGQLIFNRGLSTLWRVYLLAVLGAVLVFVFGLERATASHWISVVAAAGVLGWLRFPRLRWLALVVLLVLVSTGLLSSAIYDFAGGDAEWEDSGGSRMALIGRVIEVSMRNPITGLGPAAYRPYAAMKPLAYGRAFWVVPRINSHNNYVDLFSQVGLLGLGLFFWFAWEVFRLGWRLRARFAQGFAAGYVNAMLAAWAGSLILMLFADWILPFVYNISFGGFQASVLVWVFLGGLVALEQIANQAVVG